MTKNFYAPFWRGAAKIEGKVENWWPLDEAGKLGKYFDKITVKKFERSYLTGRAYAKQRSSRFDAGISSKYEPDCTDYADCVQYTSESAFLFLAKLVPKLVEICVYAQQMIERRGQQRQDARDGEFCFSGHSNLRKFVLEMNSVMGSITADS